MTSAGFDLVTRPWIRARALDGSVADHALADVLGTAPDLAGLAGEVPTQDAAMQRLLLAVLRRSYPEVRSPREWARLWDAGRFDIDRVRDYLNGHRDRFDLLHPTTPFYQVAELRTAKGELTELARLIPDIPAGHQYFTTRAGDELRSMSFAEAARWIVHCQAYDASGIKSGAVGDERVKNGKGYPIGIAWCGWLGLVVAEGRSLFETLMLNLQGMRTLPPAEVDLPVWERPPQGPGVEVGHELPAGPADLLTWQSRRIRLGHDGQRATGVLIANGDPLHARGLVETEPMTSWRFSEAQTKTTQSPTPVYMPRTHRPDRAVWRGLSALLARDDSAARTRAGGWLEWLAELRSAGHLAADHPLRLHTIGMEYGVQSAVIADIADDALNLRLAVLTDEDLTGIAVAGVDDADAAVRALGQLAADLVRASGGGRELAGVSRDDAREQGYAALDPDFRRWIAGLRADTSRNDARTAWQIRVRQVVSTLGHELLDGAAPTAWAGRTDDSGRPINGATAASWFHIDVKKALPLAHPSLEGAVS
ncbi:type I-E CRISPR-associated protein Cse1/CasA [Nocardioides sp. LMS-CY]|uniref:type I-E CRISPR-associated protein Cse1/CasA n=1 Tax=Nocardioides sp. (strain LMS-CY) TaxID=2840457 RepID=UPI001C0068C3|nr:type I-E CRISPR-associated protein Cse1/CasA [Nocardioides sp. LMS-CY]QWF21562.1 type I-E CRISPR-associated protein Cse1/CasA [Nocardioides sp. LMS-CY]